MARNTITFDYPSTVSGVITSLDGGTIGQRWDNVTDQALEAHVDGNWSDYIVTTAQVGTTTEWTLTIPATLPAGRYGVRFYAGTPVVTSTAIGYSEFFWDGADAYEGMDRLNYYEVQAQNGLTLYAVFRNAAGQYWNGSSFEAFNASNWATYDVAGTEVASANLYQWTSTPAGALIVEVRSQIGGSPAANDPQVTGGSLRL